MKCNKSFIVTVAALAIIALFVWNRIERLNNGLTTTDEGARVWMLTHPQHKAVTNSPAPLQSSNQAPHDLEIPSRPNPAPGIAKRAANFTADEKGDLTNKFEAKFKPAYSRWLAAYQGHVSVKPEDLTLEQFHSRLGTHLYTFMIGDTTLTFAETEGGARVMYLMTVDGARNLNSTPKLGEPPDLSVPIKREEIISMVKADCGIEFKPNEVSIKPTGAASSLMGGAFVDVGEDINNDEGRNFSKTNFSMVFGSDGKLVNYLRSR